MRLGCAAGARWGWGRPRLKPTNWRREVGSPRQTDDGCGARQRRRGARRMAMNYSADGRRTPPTTRRCNGMRSFPSALQRRRPLKPIGQSDTRPPAFNVSRTVRPANSVAAAVRLEHRASTYDFPSRRRRGRRRRRRIRSRGISRYAIFWRMSQSDRRRRRQQLQPPRSCGNCRSLAMLRRQLVSHGGRMLGVSCRTRNWRRDGELNAGREGIWQRRWWRRRCQLYW